ncbi:MULTISPECIES: hypothetical protein [Frigoribacterium]|jgi:hypothetical protein|uniref:hypothetical protein n=2 Tax=Microbacteriaceae TaxID=85023 RepID=UPI000B166DB2|nr:MULTISPECIES: hypothetical protein [Frigoribacterium]MBD8139477.1 hypothetical protein [Frigoribacterium sp. CFBP 13605]ROS53974.1 hypothetical protein EDF21_1832 [Frigoribacterium sp. PhB118]
MSGDDKVKSGLEAERDALRELGSQLLALIPSGSDRIRMQTSMARGVMAGETLLFAADGSQESAAPARRTFEAARRLRRLMYKPGAGTWFTAVFTVTAAGKLSAQYDYDNEPELGHFGAEEYRADFEDFPRTAENTPEWLAAILAGAPTRHDLVGRDEGPV